MWRSWKGESFPQVAYARQASVQSLAHANEQRTSMLSMSHAKVAEFRA